MKAGILLVEDDHFFAKVIKRHLEKEGFNVVHCLDGDEAWEAFQERAFDICLLDIIMPGKDGFSLAQEIRNRDTNVPIIFISSRYMEQDRLNGFAAGGDDYMVKPFNIEELQYRIDVFLKRSRLLQSRKVQIYQIGSLEFNYTELKIYHAPTNATVNLPPKEAELLKFLCENPNRKLKRENILLSVWGSDDFFAGRTMDVYLTRLRKHFRMDDTVKLETFHGKGLRLMTDEQACLLDN
ncbi:DNA-binding response regulator, OmpR family, contains REC and winged-helix (wHTH) domain [Chitinophaga rupis]|uniref:DNA-binding response regulator, OmpR family, contains REC and winged-helix (WHTH) domain n=1 Tax=Chitinophaga rupis TaxID=573321 RepID=A0A1H8D4L5_9BACT|nr:response regulator transcription factor [Chitinophaga rupis]SEN02253.1 DNA-binding response regulator, OmpR family, contains REC and winged-helix (wHTH) domain [Chitinophaga rupis]